MRLTFLLLTVYLSLFISFSSALFIHQASAQESLEVSNENSDLWEKRHHQPLIVYQPDPPYPQAAVKHRVTGSVKLRFWVNAQGITEHVDVTEVDPVGYGLREAAMNVAQKVRFIAPQVGGINVVSEITIVLKFTPELLVKDLRKRGLNQEADDFTNQIKYSRDQQRRSQSGADSRNHRLTDVSGISIHSIIDVPKSKIQEINETEMPRVEGPVETVEGLILEQGTRRPIPRAVVSFEGFEARRVTDEWGHFQFLNVPVGRLKIHVECQGYSSQYYPIIVEPQSATRAHKIFLQPLSFNEQEAVGEHIPPRSTTRHHVGQEELRSIAGVDGSFLHVMRDLPSLYRAPFDLDGSSATRTGGAMQWGGSGELIFRGGVEGSAYLLGAPVLTLTHLNQARTILPSLLMTEVQIEPDYSFEYGGAGGGMLTLRLAPPPEDRRRLEVEINPFEVSGVMGGSVTPRTTLTGALKIGLMRNLQHLIGTEEWLQYGAQVPQSQDLHLHVTHRMGAHQLSFLSTWHQSFWSEDYRTPHLELNERRGKVGQAQGGINARLQWSYASRKHQLNQRLSISLDQFNFSDIRDQRSALAQSLSHLYIADRLKLRLNQSLWLSTGLEQKILYSHLTHQGASLWVEGQGRSIRRVEPSSERESGLILYTPSAWVGLEGRWRRLHLLFGSRVNYWSETEQITAEPRLTLRYLAAFGTILKFGGGLYTQQILPRYFDPHIGVGTAQGDRLRVPQHIYSSLGLEQRFTRELYLDVTGFYRNLSDRLVADPDPTVRFASTGTGQAYGGEALLRYEPDSRAYGWISYSFTHARFLDRVGALERRSDHDQTHNLSVVAGWKYTRAFHINARWRYLSGAPYSPLPNRTFDSDQGQYNFAGSLINASRYSSFHQLDLRADYRWSFSTWSLLTYLQVHNLYNQRNDETPHPFEGVVDEAPLTLRTWPTWVSLGARASF